MDRRRTWGEDRVYFHDVAGNLCRMNAQWTSAADADAFVVIAAGRSSLRVSDLLQLAAVVEQLKATAVTDKSGRRKGPSVSIK